MNKIIQLNRPINHIVLSGGAYLGLYELGALMYLNKAGFYDLKNITSIHGTSIGGLLGTILCLDMKWDDITDYFVKRPFIKMINISPSMFFDIIPNKGLLGINFFENMLKPLMKSKDIEIDITLEEFYKKTKKELYLYAVDINKYELKEISYKTYPNMQLIKGIQMTCALPYMFQPVWYENTYYLDGGLLNNYPIDKCIEKCRIDEDIENTAENNSENNNKCKNNNNSQYKDNENKENNETIYEYPVNTYKNNNILGLKFQLKNDIENLNEDSNIFEYGYFLYRKMVRRMREDNTKPNIEYELVIPCQPINMNEGYDILINEKKRLKYIEDGENYAKLFLNYKNLR